MPQVPHLRWQAELRGDRAPVVLREEAGYSCLQDIDEVGEPRRLAGAKPLELASKALEPPLSVLVRPNDSLSSARVALPE
jgi:hypothetical protein